MRVRATFEGHVFFLFTSGFALAALALEQNLVFATACLALGAGLAARPLARRNLATLRVRRLLPDRAREGEPLKATYEVAREDGGGLVGLEVEGPLPAAARPRLHHLTLPGVAAGVSAKVQAPLVFRRRGLHALGDLVVRSRFPLGFFRAEVRQAAASTVLVRPRVGRVTAALRRHLRGEATARARPSLHARGDEVLHGVREFREGDDPRRIHWRTTARRGVLALSEWRREQGREILLLLGRSCGAGAADQEAFERAVRVAATAWVAARRERLPVTLRLGSPDEGDGRGGGSTGEGLDRLARVRGQAGRRPRAALRSLARARRPRVVLYVAAGPERGIGRRLAAAAGRGGSWLLLRADGKDVARWVRGLS